MNKNQVGPQVGPKVVERKKKFIDIRIKRFLFHSYIIKVELTNLNSIIIGHFRNIQYKFYLQSTFLKVDLLLTSEWGYHKGFLNILLFKTRSGRINIFFSEV